MLSDREQRALQQAEELLLRQDEDLVRAFNALAQHDPPAPRAPVAPEARAEPAAEPSKRRARLSLHGQLIRAFFALGILVMLAVCAWAFYLGQGTTQLLTVVVLLPAIGLAAFTVLVLTLRDDRDR